MRKLTPMQAHVFAHIDRVLPLPRKLEVPSALPRYQLDGKDCTAQITGLIVKRWIAKRSDGFQRLGVQRSAVKLVGDRQAPLASSLEEIRASLFLP